MHINHKGWKIRLNSIIRLEWRKSNYIRYPKLILHEKYEGYVKAILRVMTFIGIATSFVTLEPVEGAILSIVLLLIEQFFEKTLFEYTIIIARAFPDFEVEYDQWCEMGFAFPTIAGILPVVGPAYKNEEYAIKFFRYIKSWGQIDRHDRENNVIISFVIEPDNIYTTYLYPISSNSTINNMFEEYAEKSKLEKYGKSQQELIAAPIYYRINPYKDGFNLSQFLRFQENGSPFRLAPFVFNAENRSMRLLESESFVKYEYKFKYRRDVTPHDLEYYYKHPRYD